MFRKITLLAVLFSFALPALAQHELNAFKYIIIPRKYDFLKTENQYRLNTITKHLFDQEGFMTLIQGDYYPQDVRDNPCIAGTVDVINESSMFKTKVKIVVKNCYDQVIYTSKEGTSKIKEYDKTYREALEKSFVSVQMLDYAYDPALLVNQNKASKSQAIVPVASVEKPAAEPVQTQEKQVAEPVVAEEKKLEPMEPVTSNTAVPVAAAPAAAVAAAPAAAKEEVPEKVEEPVVASKSDFAVAKSYKNDTTSFFLIEQNNVLVAYVIESKNENYKKGQTIGTFEKTSLPNVFRVAWKKKEQDIDETTAYFDEAGNLKIDIHRDGKLEVLTFTEEK
jgi:hypothetical protein